MRFPLSACALAVIFASALHGQTATPLEPPHGPVYQAQSTKEMGERLAAIYKQTDFRADPNKQAERAAYYKQLLDSSLPATQQVPVRFEMGNELLRSGQTAKAVQTFEDLRAYVTEQKIKLPRALERQTGEQLALAYLRLGEQQNCLSGHGAMSCIFPLTRAGVHQDKRGAQAAIREYTGLLNADPHDALSRWLLNVAYMQIGEYPQTVPPQWLIPEQRFASEFPLPQFPDVAMQAGLLYQNLSGGVVIEDFDGDGLLDIMVSSVGPLDPLRLYHNNGDCTFSDRSRQAGLEGETGGINLIVTDYNNDGHPDVLVLRGGWWGQFGRYPMSLLRNIGNGTFDDVTAAAGLLSEHPTHSAAWADYDNDGWLDLLVGTESTPENASPPGDVSPSVLFHNNHDGTFTRVDAPWLKTLGWVKGVAWGDYNNDGRPDLYISVRDNYNHLLRNEGPEDTAHPDPLHWRFTDVTEAAGVREPKNSFATWFFDYDNDGWPDIFVAGYSAGSMQDVGLFEAGEPARAELPRLFHNNHDGTFTEVSKQTHLDRAILTMGAGFGDLDNDGWLDIYLGNGEPSYQSLLPNRVFRNDGGRRWQDVTTAGGFGNLQKGHGVAFADLENRGVEDVFEEMGGALPGDLYYSSLYRNPGTPNHSITLLLEGVESNRAAFGARIAIEFVEGCPHCRFMNRRHVYRTVGFGSSFGDITLRQHIGLGSATKAESIEITWPRTGKTQRFTNIAADRFYKVRENSIKIEEWRPKSFSFPLLPKSAPMPAMGATH